MEQAAEVEVEARATRAILHISFQQRSSFLLSDSAYVSVTP
jgi:hypothetical protein